MKIKGLTENELTAAVVAVSETLYNGNLTFKREPEKQGNFLLFTLTVKNSADDGGRRSHTGRRVGAACWHAHRDVMQAIFAINPDALLVSVFARYEGISGFRSDFEETGYRNIGNMAQPCEMHDACLCNDETMPADSVNWYSVVDFVRNDSSIRQSIAAERIEREESRVV